MQVCQHQLSFLFIFILVNCFFLEICPEFISCTHSASVVVIWYILPWVEILDTIVIVCACSCTPCSSWSCVSRMPLWISLSIIHRLCILVGHSQLLDTVLISLSGMTLLCCSINLYLYTEFHPFGIMLSFRYKIIIAQTACMLLWLM